MTTNLRLSWLGLVLCAAALGANEAPPPSGPGGTVKGTVTVAGGTTPLAHASVVLSPGGRTASTSETGQYIFRDVPPGHYVVLAHLHALSDDRQTVDVTAGAELSVDFALRLNAVHESVTVTASGQEEAALEAFQSVTSLEGYQLTTKSSSTSLGDVLENESGMAKRSFGPGTTRPVVRGFDGDRVTVLQDGVSTGTISSQSGDHGEPVDAASIERVEVVKGPATLLYGSNAMGGVVNVLTDHHITGQHPHEGLHGSLGFSAGSANAQGGGNASFEYGHGNWLVYGSGGGLRTGDYQTPIGRVLNSGSDMTDYKTGFGHYGERFGFNVNYQHYETTYGIPAASRADEQSTLDMRRNAVRFNGALKQAGPWFEQVDFDFNYSDYTHREISDGVTGTQFFNKQATYRTVFDQRRHGGWDGSFGASGLYRDYKALGAEALTPPVRQSTASAFALEQFTRGRLRLQFGARLEHNGYSPEGLPARAFTGASASAGAIVPAWKDGAVVLNYLHSYRAPALEELYNYGPHPGNLAFEIGNPALKRELGDGVEVSLRHQTQAVRLEANFFRYQMHDFVYFQPLGSVEEGLPVYAYDQAGARFLGAEAKAQFRLLRPLWLNTAVDYVDAHLTLSERTNLPRIPPGRARVGLDWLWKGFSLRPELIATNKQWLVAPNETTTPGYVAVNVNAGYTVSGQHALHAFNVTAFNMGDRLYYNHLSFIKAFAPEIGRGVRFGYTVTWF